MYKKFCFHFYFLNLVSWSSMEFQILNAPSGVKSQSNFMNKNCFELCEYYWKNLWNLWFFSNFKNLTWPPIFKSFTCNFNLRYSNKFYSYDNNQTLKNHLLVQKNQLARTTWARAWLRARQLCHRQMFRLKLPKSHFLKFIVIDTVCAQPCAHPYDAL